MITRIAAALLCLGFWTARAESSPEELVRGILQALEAKDGTRLKSFAAPEADVKNLIWPSVVSHMAGGTMNGEKFTAMYLKNSDAAANERLATFGGKKLELVKITLPEPTKKTKSYRILPAPVVTVRDEAGREEQLKLVGGILDKGGDLKVATYYVSPLQK